MQMLFSWLAKSLSGNISRVVKELQSFETMSRDAICAFQLDKLNLLIDHFRSYPFYAALLAEHGVGGKKLHSFDDLRSFPVVTKDVIRENLEYISGRKESVLLGSTSGSTGKNFRFYQNPEMLLYRRAQNILMLNWVGIDHWLDRKFTVWGLSPKNHAMEGLLQSAKVFIQNSMRVQAYGLDEDRCIEIIQQIRRYKPAYIHAYPGYAYEIARAGIKHGIEPPAVRAFVVSGETMFDHQAEAIREYFGNNLFSRYGSREFGAVAHDRLGGNGLYVHPAKAFVESDENGDLLVTDLTNTATPFIRYAIGDAGTVVGPEPGASAFCYQRIADLVGRTHDIIKTRSGKLLPGQFWTIMSKTVPGIGMFQVVQHDQDHVDLKIVAGPDYRDENEHKLHDELRQIAGDEMIMRVVKVDHIELTPSGKRKFVIKQDSSQA